MRKNGFSKCTSSLGGYHRRSSSFKAGFSILHIAVFGKVTYVTFIQKILKCNIFDRSNHLFEWP